MEDVIETTTLHDWKSPTPASRKEYAFLPESKSVKAVRCGLDERAPSTAMADKGSDLHRRKIKHRKTEQQWKVKKRIEDAVLRGQPMIIGRIVPTAVSAVAVDDRTIEEQFREEAEKWTRDTAFLSSTPKMVLHDSYQRIMAMGPEVLPFLLKDLQENRRSWFWALRHVTRANPVAPQDQGNLDKMIAAWVAWGKREGLI